MKNRLTPEDWQELLKVAKAFANSIHEKQKRRDGSPYMTHVNAVAQSVAKYGPEYETVATLHDTWEDAKDKAQFMSTFFFFPRFIVEEVLAITKLPSDHDYGDYIISIERYPVAALVKVADMLHNLSCQPKESSRKKYIWALKFLVPNYRFSDETDYVKEAEAIIHSAYKHL